MVKAFCNTALVQSVLNVLCKTENDHVVKDGWKILGAMVEFMEGLKV